MYPELYSLVVAALYVVIGHVLGMWGSTALATRLARTSLDASVRNQLANAAYPAILSLAVLGALVRLGFPGTLIAVALLVLGSPFALGARDLVRHQIAGHWVLTQRPFAAGDLITVAGVTGTVVAIQATSTTLLADDGAVIHLPHALCLAGPIVNHGVAPRAPATAS